MAATVTLSTTTLTAPVSASDTVVTLASTSGIVPGVRLYLADAVAARGELVAVIGLGVGTSATVRRGVDGTASSSHAAGSTVTIGRADQFYQDDPVGAPPAAIAVSPWINVITGRQWLAEGDEVGPGAALRFWQQVSTTTTIGALGVRVTTQTPIS